MHKLRCAYLSKNHNIWCHSRKKRKEKKRIKRKELESQKDLLDVGPKKKLYISKTIFYRITNMMSEFKILFSFSFPSFQISDAVFTGWQNFFSVLDSCVLFSGLLDNFEDVTMRNLTFFVRFLPLFF